MTDAPNPYAVSEAALVGSEAQGVTSDVPLHGMQPRKLAVMSVLTVMPGCWVPTITWPVLTPTRVRPKPSSGGMRLR